MDADVFFNELDVWVRRDVIGKAVFPRQMFLTRMTVKDEFEYFSNFRANRGENVYLSVFSEYQIRRRLFDTIFLDFDPTDKNVPIKMQVESAYAKMRKVGNILRDNGIDFRVYFSGRGFHLFIDFELVRVEHYSPAVRRYLEMLGLIDRRGLSNLIDVHVVGDIRRMARAPLSINAKTGMKMKRIDFDWDFNTAWQYVTSDMLVDVPVAKHNRDIVKVLIEFDEQMTKHRETVIDDSYLDSWDMRSFPKCMYEGVMRLKYLGELDDVWRWNLANFLLRSKGFDEATAVFKYGVDYNEQITEYRLNHIIRKEYNIMSCKRLKDVGICPYDVQRKCPFYPSLNHWLPPWEKVKKHVSNE